MAKYEEYVKESGLEDEIQEAAAATEERKLEGVPDSVVERFKDKNVEDVLKSYAELEKAYSQQGQKHGELRKSFDEFITLQSQTASVAGSEPTEEEEPITVDDLYEDPAEVVSRVVKKETGKRLDQIEQSLQTQQVQVKINALSEKYPDWQDTVSSEEFKAWALAKPYRQQMVARADQFDFEAAEEVLSMYADLHAKEADTAAQDAERERQKALADATMESSSAESAASDEVVSRQVVIDAKLAAKRGNAEARNWLAANAAAIQQAYAEGRVTD